MTRSDCERWMHIRDRETLDEPVTAAERSFCAEHERSCGDCAREAAAWAELEAGLRHSLSASAAGVAPSAAPPASRLAAPRSSGHTKVARRHSWWAPALLAAAGVALVFGAAVAIDRAATGSAATATLSWGELAVEGVVRSGPSAVREGESVQAQLEPGCLQLPDAVELCLHPGSQVLLRSLSGARREIELQRGRVVASLAKQAEGVSFSVVTPRGRVTAIGTVFSVEAGQGGSRDIARVQEGVVEVQASEAPSRRLAAGNALPLGITTESALSPAEQERDLRLVRHEASRPVRGDRAPVAAEQVARSPEVPAPAGQASVTPQDPSAVRARSAPVATPSAAEQLAAARRALGRGDVAGAAQQYRALQRSHPRSPEAHTAHVALGELELRLRRPEQALRAFDAYLARGGGALAEEARHGRIRALGALGRGAEERSAIRQFLATHPRSPHAPALERRLVGRAP